MPRPPPIILGDEFTGPTKFIIALLQNLTVTVISAGSGLKKRFYSNFNTVNKTILSEYRCTT
jgi:hypothetical protein